MVHLIKEVIPKSWDETGVLRQTATSKQHPSVDWLERLWVYLRRQHPDDLSPYLGVPLLPLGDDEVVPLSLPSQVILRSEYGVTLNPGLCHCLELVGVTVVDGLTEYVRCHAAVMGSFVRPPLHENVVDAMFTASVKTDVVAVFRDHVTGEEKRELLSLIGMMHCKNFEEGHKKFLRSLPLFKSTRSTTDQPQFVSAAEVTKAHAGHCVVPLDEAFIDVSSNEARTAADILGVDILTDVSFIKDHVLPEIRKRRLTSEDVQKCLHYVFDNIQRLQQDDPHLLRHLGDIQFVTTVTGLVVSPSSVFDPIDATLQTLFVGEHNHFPGGFYSSPENLIILRKMGMKNAGDVSACDILNTANRIAKMNSTRSNDTTQKAEALLSFLANCCDLLREEIGGKRLVDWLKDIAWVLVCTDMPEQLPADLKVDAGVVVCTAADVKSYDWASIVGSVVPIVRCRANETISQLFGWDSTPGLDDVVRQFTKLVATYPCDGLADYTFMVRNIYTVFSKQSVDDVQEALQAAGLYDWVWHGEGFTAVERALLQPPPLPLAPYAYTLPQTLQRFHTLLSACGVTCQCSNDVLVNVLHDMKAKYDSGDTCGAQVLRNNKNRHRRKKEIESDLRLANDILNHIKLSSYVPDRVLVPAAVEGTVRLLPAAECTYCDVEWLRKGFGSVEFDESDGIILVHHHLPTSTAAALGVPTLMSRMLHADELEITSFGQTEPLTSTLRRMLEDYTDGLAIPKELVQNADDAGATEVRFMYDERTHSDARKYLFDEGMRECQGPALWCYSNSTFTDSDLDNIIRLGGAAKKTDATKIGRFGLGFNVVYNLTDVPSFVTGNVVVFFDPHTTHLGHSIHDKSKPGIKIDLRRNKTLLRKLSHQFQPYKGVFGCDMDAVSGPSWPGTLFRFPLRTKLQAQRSDISGLHYDTDHMSQLLTLLADNAHNLLLFTQHVKKVSLWHLTSDASPENAVNIFSVCRDTVTTIRDLSPHARADALSGVKRSGTFLKAAVRYMNEWSENPAMKAPQSSTIIRVEISLNDTTTLLQTRPTASVKFWLRCLCVSEGQALRLAREMTKERYVPATAVAVRLQPAEKGYVPATPGEDDRDAGQVFNFLPLPVRSGLPVHINGMFAVHSNRRRLVERTADDTGSDVHAWNDALMEDGVVMAYMQMLQDLQSLLATVAQDVPFYRIWPTVADTESDIQPVVNAFYRILAARAATVPVIYNADDASIATLDNVVFLHSELVASPQLQQLVSSVVRQCVAGRTPVSVGRNVLDSFRKAGCGTFIDPNIYDMKRFFTDIFFPNLQRLTAAERDPLVWLALESKKVDSLLAEYPCVPSTPDGETLRTPQDLVHPRGAVAKLYLPEDAKFPYGDYFTDDSCLHRLQKLGMACDEITWDNLIERLESIESVNRDNRAVAQNRTHCALEFLTVRLMRQKGGLTANENETELETKTEAARETIVQIPFVPLLPRPRRFPVTWKNDEYSPTTVLPPVVLYPHEQYRLVSAVHSIADDKNMKAEVREFLGLLQKKPSLDDVMKQFDDMLGTELSSLGCHEYNAFHSACLSVYGFLQEQSVCERERFDEARRVLNSRPCILVQHHFQLSRKVTFSGSPDCEPYLYRLPAELTRRHKPLMKLLGVQDFFATVDYVDAIRELKKTEGDVRLSGRRLQLAVTLATCLHSSVEQGHQQLCDVQDEHGTIYLPNERGVLHPINDLCYNDNPRRGNDVPSAPLRQMDKTLALGGYTHPALSLRVAVGLGVRTIKTEIRNRFSHGIPFGQKQDLTTSLNRILDSYPLNFEILKELIQNADDAGATEIHFVNDSRHHRDEAVFGPSWKPLQGPALCVYNNRPFTEEDLKGIQKLGEGSKAQDSTKTGQYGIGFSALYHLTDTPSVLTRLEGQHRSLSVFDPHLCYVPGANVLEPGMQYDVDQLQPRYPDVFSCYLPECFDVDNATLFRFPLRTDAMADTSKISKRSVSPDKLQILLDELQKEALESLLFTNNVKKISISKVDNHTGKLVNTYVASAQLSGEELTLKSELGNATKIAALQEHGGRLRNTPLHKVTTTLVVKDTKGVVQKWCVSEQLGTRPDVVVPKSVSRAICAGELRLLPRGGVACLLESKVKLNRNKGSVFCFLPLPIKTTLPVHINGHFALGYENRRSLWDKADRDSYKTEWNEFLCREVIAPCYLRLLVAVRANFLKTGVDKNELVEVRRSRAELDKAIAAYLSQLPSFDQTQPDWQVLVQAVYDCCARTNAPIFPSVRPHADIANTWHITWLPAIRNGDQQAFFSESSTVLVQNPVALLPSAFGVTHGRYVEAKETIKTDAEILQDVLLVCGMKLVVVSTRLIKNIQQAELTVALVTPENVVAFFSSYSGCNPSHHVGKLPKPIKESAFKTQATLHVVLAYCQRDPQFISRLDGTPLLLTADNVLRVFDRHRPVYHTSYADLAPHRKDLLLHDCMRLGVFAGVSPSATPVLSPFTIADLANILDRELPRDRLWNTGCHVRWPPEDSSLPRDTWLRRLWDFIDGQLRNDDVSRRRDVRTLIAPKSGLLPLSQWCLLPARVDGERCLAPINMASTVYLPIYYQKDPDLYQVLGHMHLPEVDLLTDNLPFSMTASTISLKVDILQVLVATVDKPHLMLGVVHTNMKKHGATAAVRPEDGRRLLTYFCDNLNHLQMYDANYVSRLKELPLYTTVCNDVISLTGSCVYVQPGGIPSSGMDVWRSRSGNVFLRQDDKLKPLFNAIGCVFLTVGDVYCKFIFQHLEYLSSEQLMAHLYYVYTTYMRNQDGDYIYQADQTRIVSSLQTLPVLKHDSGDDLRPVSDFYDPDNAVFRAMLPDDMFPPKRLRGMFSKPDWKDFLSKLGLQLKVTPTKFCEFATQVEREGVANSSCEQTARRSQALVEHLFALEDTDLQLQHATMQSVADVAFVREARVIAALKQLHPQRDADGRYISFRDSVSTKHASIAWTQSKLLPHWADPDHVFRNQQRAAEAKQRLGVLESPPVQTVAMHLRALCETETKGDIAIKQKVFKSIYSHLQTYGLEDPDVIRRVLANTPCVLVDDGSVVFAHQTVVDMYEKDEIRPYLYKLPLSLGEFSALFRSVGATERATSDQYIGVLTHMYARTSSHELHPNEVLSALKAMAGLFQALSESSHSPDVPIVFLLSEAGTLVQSTRLVYNDCPAFYERAGALPGLQFMAKVHGCGDSTPEESLRKLPAPLQPKMLSSVVSERLTRECKLSERTHSLATRLSARLRSAVFLSAIDRLARHEAHLRSTVPDSERVADATNRLSTICVHGVVGDVVTELVYRDQPVDGSRLRKACFVEKRTQLGHAAQWPVYVSNNADLSLDLLVPLADVINEIMSGLLRDAVLYLQPIIACPTEDDIGPTLNNLNVREHRRTPGSERHPLIPRPGDPVSGTHLTSLGPRKRPFSEGEYVGYEENTGHPVVYGIVKKPRLSGSSACLVTVGKRKEVTAVDAQLYTFVRK